MPSDKDRGAPYSSAPGGDPDAQLDDVLREIGKELLEEEVPERLLRVIRAAAGATEATKKSKTAEDPQSGSAEKLPKKRPEGER